MNVKVFASGISTPVSDIDDADAVEFDGYGVSTSLIYGIGSDWQGPYWIRKDTERKYILITIIDPMAKESQ